jgi:hypothetical protein
MNRGITFFSSRASLAFFLACFGFNGWAAESRSTSAAQRILKTEHGQPNLQGYWDFGTQTPFQRPKELGEKRAYTPEEARAMQIKLQANNAKLDEMVDLARNAPKAGDSIGQESDLMSFERRDDLTRVDGEYRTSLVVDPPNGRIAVRPEFIDHHGRRTALGLGAYDGPDTMDSPTRCLGAPGVPTLYPLPWNANLQIVQNTDHVLLFAEGQPDARIVRLNGHHHGLRVWSGDSIGEWQGNTLVVRSMNFRPEQSYAYIMKTSDEFSLTEHFTLLGPDEILYSFTVTDPKALIAPFTVERTLKRLGPNVRLYEVACHEGNYAMGWILSGTRKQERDAAATQADAPR